MIQDKFKIKLQHFIVCSNHFSKIWKYNRIGESNTPSIFRDLEIKWSKVSRENLEIWCLKINNWLMYCFDIDTLLWHLMDFVILFHWSECYFNPHIHKIAPRGPKHDFWQPVLIYKCQKGQISCVPLFSCQKTYIIIFQNSQEYVNFIPIYFDSPGTHQLNKDNNFSGISPLQVKLWYHNMFSRITFTWDLK